MTRDEATAETQRAQRLNPDAKWIAAERDGEWTIGRVDLTPDTAGETHTATQPPPLAPRDDPYSQVENVARLYGGG